MRMGKVQVRVKAPFGELVLEGESHDEVLSLLRSIPPGFMDELSNLALTKLAPSSRAEFEGIIEFTTEGPVLVTKQPLTHYEAIGLMLYASEGKMNTASRISRLLESSGTKAMVPARLNEMVRKGLAFKPDPSKPEFKLTVQGEQWVKTEVLPKSRGAAS